MLNKLSSMFARKPKASSPEEPQSEHFSSERLEAWRARQSSLAEHFVETLDMIEKVGWQTWNVGSTDAEQPNFCYTVGVYDIFGLPELICVGLPINVGGSTLNHVVRLMREGRNLTDGRIDDVLGPGIEVEFQPVEPKWLHRVMLRTHWYYKGEDVPVLQLIFPDLENRFPWEEEFNEYFRQPMLAPGYLPQDLEREFWDAHGMSFDKSTWKFSEPPYTRVMTSLGVEENQEPINYVAHYDDGAWMFLGSSMMESGSATSRLRRMVAADNTVEKLIDLPKGWIAVREDASRPWERLPDEDEEEED